MDELTRKCFEKEREAANAEVPKKLAQLAAALSVRGVFYGGAHVVQVYEIRREALIATLNGLVNAFKSVSEETRVAPTAALLAEAKSDAGRVMIEEAARFQAGLDKLCLQLNSGSRLQEEMRQRLRALSDKILHENYRDLEIWIETAARKPQASAPATGRLTRVTPAANLEAIAALAQSAAVGEVFDPYLDDKGLANLKAISNLGLQLAPTVRLLTSSSGVKRLSKEYLAAWQTELNVTASVKTVNNPAHRRFMLLSTGKSLIIGCSLNGTEKDEAIHLESDSDDRPFFEAEWLAAKIF